MDSHYELNSIKKLFVSGREFGALDCAMLRSQTIVCGFCGMWYLFGEYLIVSPCKTISDGISGIISRATLL